jgi:hypothetical protein
VAVDVGVDEADRQALHRHRDREVGGDRRLADAALARGDGVHAGEVAGLGEHDLALVVADERGPQLLALRLVHHVELDLDGADAGHGTDGLDHARGDRVAHGAAGDGEPHRDPCDAVDDLARLHHLQVGDRAADLGVLDRREGSVDQVEQRLGHAPMLRAAPTSGRTASALDGRE